MTLVGSSDRREPHEAVESFAHQGLCAAVFVTAAATLYLLKKCGQDQSAIAALPWLICYFAWMLFHGRWIKGRFQHAPAGLIMVIVGVPIGLLLVSAGTITKTCQAIRELPYSRALSLWRPMQNQAATIILWLQRNFIEGCEAQTAEVIFVIVMVVAISIWHFSGATTREISVRAATQQPTVATRNAPQDNTAKQHDQQQPSIGIVPNRALPGHTTIPYHQQPPSIATVLEHEPGSASTEAAHVSANIGRQSPRHGQARLVQVSTLSRSQHRIDILPQRSLESARKPRDTNSHLQTTATTYVTVRPEPEEAGHVTPRKARGEQLNRQGARTRQHAQFHQHESDEEPDWCPTPQFSNCQHPIDLPRINRASTTRQLSTHQAKPEEYTNGGHPSSPLGNPHPRRLVAVKNASVSIGGQNQQPRRSETNATVISYLSAAQANNNRPTTNRRTTNTSATTAASSGRFSPLGENPTGDASATDTSRENNRTQYRQERRNQPQVSFMGRSKKQAEKGKKSLVRKNIDGPTERRNFPPVPDKPAKELTIEELRALMQAKRVPPLNEQRLTEEEVGLPLRQLWIKWKIEGQAARDEKVSVSPFDYDHFEDIEPERKRQMTRGQVKDFIRKAKDVQWIANMVKKGIPLKECQVCHRMAKEDHQCWPTRYTVPGPHGSQRQVIFSSSGSGIALKEQPYVDTEKVAREYHKLEADRRISAERAETYQDLLHRKEQEEAIRQMETPSTSSRTGTQQELTRNGPTQSTGLLQPKRYEQNPQSEIAVNRQALMFNPTLTQEQREGPQSSSQFYRQTNAPSLVPPSNSQHASQPFQGGLGD